MTVESDYIYIFFHVPKCAGTTLRRHIEGNFSDERRLSLYNSDKRRLTKSDVFHTLDSLTNEKKNALKIIYGHEVYFGIHEFFSRPARYFTFVRDPIEKTISFYNYRMQQAIRKNELAEKDIPPFDTWLEKSLGMHDGMLGDFLKYGFGESADDKRLFEKILSAFYFVGITERYSEEALYMYHELGIKKFFENQNKSKVYFRKDSYDKARSLILEKTQRDNQFYQYALEVNAKFRDQTPDFTPIVQRMKLKKQLSRFFGRVFGN